jgi:quinol monooxygenase YgiN
VSKPVHVVVKVVARADAVSDVRSIVLTLAEKSRAESGCTSYEVIQNLAEPETFLLVEEWENLVALEAHNKTAHFHEAVEKSVPLLASALEVGCYTAIG